MTQQKSPNNNQPDNEIYSSRNYRFSTVIIVAVLAYCNLFQITTKLNKFLLSKLCNFPLKSRNMRPRASKQQIEKIPLKRKLAQNINILLRNASFPENKKKIKIEWKNKNLEFLSSGMRPGGGSKGPHPQHLSSRKGENFC